MGRTDRNFTRAKIASRLAHLEKEIGRYIEEAERADRQETGEARTEKIAHLTRRYHRVRQEMDRRATLRRELATAPDGQISLTDPDARAMATRAQHSGHVGYNVQSVVDAETHLIVAHEVTNQGHDRDQLASMAGTAKTALRRDDLHILADKGYFSGGEILACHEQGITATVPRPDTSGSRVHGRYLKADCVCDPDKDIYRCPAGVALSYRSTVEHSFGTIKTWMGHTHFPTRRLRNVRTEMALNVLACNIKRMVAMIGIRGVMAAIPG